MSAAGTAEGLVGAVLNRRWRLVRLLGEGGMGAVYEAEGPAGTGKRAIKLLHPEYVSEELILARFATEFEATRSLSHPNIAQVLETGTAENGTPYLVMELLVGTSVASYVDQGQALPPAQAVHIVHGVLQALAVAHARGIVHRDIKPDNLFLAHDPSGSFTVKVLDFGIAKVMDVAGGMGQKTRTGVLLGTPGYMSPEQIKSSKTVDARADLWSVGIIFYELLTGTSPFPADNEFTRLTAVLTEEVRPIEQVAPHLASWSGFLQCALAKDPRQRFQTADEMAASILATARGPSIRPPVTLLGQTSPTQVAPEESSGIMPAASLHSPSVPPPRPSSAPSAPYTISQPLPPVRSGTIASAPMPAVASHAGGGASHGGSTHVSAQHPGPPPGMHGHTPSIQVIDGSRRGAAWWVVGVVAAVAFGLGVLLGLAIGAGWIA